MPDIRVRIAYVFSSGTSDKTYTANLYADGSTSCNCPGWTKRSIRACKHTAAITYRMKEGEWNSALPRPNLLPGKLIPDYDLGARAAPETRYIARWLSDRVMEDLLEIPNGNAITRGDPGPATIQYTARDVIPEEVLQDDPPAPAPEPKPKHTRKFYKE